MSNILRVSRRPVNPAPAPADGSARDFWPAWTDTDRWAPTPDAPTAFDAAGPRPTAGPDFAATPALDAEWLGMVLRLDGGPMAELAGTDDPDLLLRFAAGAYRGVEALAEERAEQLEDDRMADERYADAFGDPADRIHPAEACGVC